MKTAVITGASSGIGELTAKKLAANGYNVVLAARREQLLEAVASQCREYGVEALVVSGDVSKKETVEHIAAAAVQRFGGFDVWVNNAGVILYGRFLDITPEEFRQVIETNFFGYVYGAREALTQFKAQGHGTLVNVASGYGVFPAPFTSPYTASKFAVRGLSASLREELSADKIRNIHVCTVLPLTMDTPVYANAANKMGSKIVPLPPVYDPDKTASAIISVIEYPRAEVMTGKALKGPALMFNMFPHLFTALLARYFNAFGYKKNRTAKLTSGNLFAPSTHTGIRGGWQTDQGGLKTKVLPLAGAAALIVLLARAGQKRSRVS